MSTVETWTYIGVLMGLGLMYAIQSSNPWLTTYCLLAQLPILLFLRRPNESAALLVMVEYIWLVASLEVFYANWLGVALWTRHDSYSPETATIMSLLWTTVLSIGIRLGAGKPRTEPQEAPSFLLRRVVVLYAVHAVVLLALGQIPIAGLRQPLGALATAKWGLLYMIVLHGRYNRSTRPLAVLIVLSELVQGWLSYFSVFRYVLIVVALATAVHKPRVTLMRVISATALLSMTVVMGSIWSYVKTDYRDRLSDGRGEQVVVLSMEERAEALTEVVDDMDKHSMGVGLEALVLRIAYIKFFSHAIDHVPQVRPHTNGHYWLLALKHITMPRLLCPGKAPLERETVMTERHTGLDLGSEHSHTEINLGLPAQNYVEFGIPWMLAPGFVLGLLLGLGYRALIRRGNRQYGDALALAACIGTFGLGSSLVKLVGMLITKLGFLLLVSLLLERRLQRFLWPDQHPGGSRAAQGPARTAKPRPVGTTPRSLS